METEKDLGLTMASSWEDTFRVFLDAYFPKEGVENFLNSLEPKTTYQEMESFLNSKLVKDRFKEEWEYQSDPKKWPKRTPEEAFSETIDQTFGNLILEIKFQEMGIQGSPDLQLPSSEELQRIKDKAELILQLKDIFVTLRR